MRWVKWNVSNPLCVAGSLFNLLFGTPVSSSCSQCCCRSSSCHPVREAKTKLNQFHSATIEISPNLKPKQIKGVVDKTTSLQSSSSYWFSNIVQQEDTKDLIWLIRYCLIRNQEIKVGTKSDLNSLPRHSWAGLNLPLTIPVRMQVESLSNLTGWWRCGQILLIGKDEHWNAF